tara:strand:+ start:106 stop:426 length:321 start_codon:yes stop_codon:yes gene_type:complete
MCGEVHRRYFIEGQEVSESRFDNILRLEAGEASLEKLRAIVRKNDGHVEIFLKKGGYSGFISFYKPRDTSFRSQNRPCILDVFLDLLKFCELAGFEADVAAKGVGV